MSTQSRILFVDDEPQILDGLRFAMRRYRQEWDVCFAENGERAISQLSEGPFDVVVSDMRMPGMDGATLLGRVRDLQPDAIRLMLSAEPGPGVLLRTVPVAHQYLSKPCAMPDLRACIGRLRDLRVRLADPKMKRIAGELRSIPVLPQVFRELGRVIGDDQSSVDDVAHIIERDAGMTARILQLANSAYFGPGRPVVRISEAVSFLGLNLLRSLTLAVGVFDQIQTQCDGFDPQAMMARSLQVAALAERILAGDPLADVAFMAGVLHDLGQLVLAAQMPREFSAALAISRAEKIPLATAEHRVFGCDHAQLGGYIVGIWGLPTALVEAVMNHCQPERSSPTRIDAVGALHIAEVLVAEARGEPAELSPALTSLAGVEDRLPDWRSRAQLPASSGS